MASSRRSRVLSPLLTVAAATAAVALVQIGRATRGLPSAMGASKRVIEPDVVGSPRYEDGVFRNVLPGTTLAPGSGRSLLRALLTRGDRGKPKGEIPLTPVAPLMRAADLAVTWLGHASALIELDGHWILADPVWADRVSPSATVGPRRLHPVPMTMEALPRLDAVIISHDHYDHLDLNDRSNAGGRAERARSSSHWASARTCASGVCRSTGSSSSTGTTRPPQSGITLTCTEARHFSGRGLKRDVTLWSSWALTGPAHRVFFGGDTGYTPAFAEIGARLGPFDLTLLPIGAYGDQWPDIHLTPEDAWRAHGDLGGKLHDADPLGDLRSRLPYLGRTDRAVACRRRREGGRRARSRWSSRGRPSAAAHPLVVPPVGDCPGRVARLLGDRGDHHRRMLDVVQFVGLGHAVRGQRVHHLGQSWTSAPCSAGRWRPSRIRRTGSPAAAAGMPGPGRR